MAASKTTGKGQPGAKASGSVRWRKERDSADPRQLVWEWDSEAPDDYDDLHERIRDETATAEDHELFGASIVDRFVSRVRAGEQVEPWIMNALATAFVHMLRGAAWDDEITLPGRQRTADRPWRDQRDLEIYGDVSNERNGGAGVVEAITRVAKVHSVSFETARSAYYRWQAMISKSVREV